jgi:hypothetical protein
MFMQQPSKTIMWVAIYGAAAYGAYYYFFNKKRYAKIIVASGNFGGGVDALANFDKPFLKSWSEASRNGQPIFFFLGKTYNTKGGRAKNN